LQDTLNKYEQKKTEHFIQTETNKKLEKENK